MSKLSPSLRPLLNLLLPPPAEEDKERLNQFSRATAKARRAKARAKGATLTDQEKKVRKYCIDNGLCVFFNHPTGCNQGDNCRYTHDKVLAGAVMICSAPQASSGAECEYALDIGTGVDVTGRRNRIVENNSLSACSALQEGW